MCYADYTPEEILLGLCNAPLSTKYELRESVLKLVAIGTLPAEYGIATDICTLTCLHEFPLGQCALAYLLGLSIDNVDFISLLSTLADWLITGRSKRYICRSIGHYVARKLEIIQRIQF